MNEISSESECYDRKNRDCDRNTRGGQQWLPGVAQEGLCEGRMLAPREGKSTAGREEPGRGPEVEEEACSTHSRGQNSRGVGSKGQRKTRSGERWAQERSLDLGCTWLLFLPTPLELRLP